MRDNRDKIFVVLGMHRSATSFIAKALHDQGVNMGDSMLGAAPSNPHGHFEDVGFVSNNVEILKAASGSWDDPPSRESIRNVTREATANLMKAKKAKMWGFKDPRTVLTFDHYKDYLEDDVYLVCMFRKRGAVVDSLAARNNMPKEEAGKLYDEYNARLIEIIKEFVNS